MWPRRVENGVYSLSSILLVVGVISIFLMVPVIVVDVLLRKLFNAPLPFTLELVSTLNVTAVFMSAAYVQRKKGHVAVSLLINRLAPGVQSSLLVFIYSVGIIIFALMTWQCGIWGLQSLEVREMTQGLINLPLYPTKLLIPLGTFAMMAVLIVDLVHAIKGLTNRSKNSERGDH